MVKHVTADTEENLDAVFAALADPIRREMIQRLSHRSTQVTELATHFPVSLPAVSKHVGVLERAGLIRRQKEGRIHHLSLEAEPLRRAQTYLQAYREFWENNLDALAEFVESTSEEEEEPSSDEAEEFSRKQKPDKKPKETKE